MTLDENTDGRCGDSADIVEDLIVDVVRQSGGDFDVSFDRPIMRWTGTAGELLWEYHEETDGPWPDKTVRTAGSDAIETWRAVGAPDMEGVWRLDRISTEGMCNGLDGCALR